jgi:phosphoglycolate phosphatase-like HAD superfamily hydrolase
VVQLLVLWDVDYTLVDSGGVGRELYQIAFRELFGCPMPEPSSMAGRTDRAIMSEVLALAGEAEPGRRIGEFHAVIAARAPGLADLVLQRSRALPGAAAALAALAGLGGGANQANGAAGPAVVQSLLTGNIRPLAEVKLRPFGLTGHLDLNAGAYGDMHEVRAELVPHARHNAAEAYGHGFDGDSTVLVGDTPLDIAAALATGARGVGVATGPFTEVQLSAAGAHAVLPDLTDTTRVLAAILGPHKPREVLV